MPLVSFTNTLNKLITSKLKSYLLVTPSLYNFMKTIGNVDTLPLGHKRFQYFDIKKPDGARMASTIHNANIISPQWGDTNVGLLTLVGKIQISAEDWDRYRTGQWIKGDLVQDTINMVVPVMLNQVDQFIAWGDEMKSPVDADLDAFQGSGAHTGIFNGGTEINAGLDEDEDMTAAGDFLNTVQRMRKALRAAGHEQAKYPILSDLDTAIAATDGNQFYSTVGIDEKQRIREKKWVSEWMDSDNFIDYTEAKYRMAMIAPKQNNNNSRNKGMANNFELVESYPFTVKPLHNGGLSSDGYFESLIIWRGAFVEYHTTAIQRTPTLTLS